MVNIIAQILDLIRNINWLITYDLGQGAMKQGAQKKRQFNF